MRLTRSFMVSLGLMVGLFVAVAPVQAGMFKKVLLGLSEAGFNFTAEENFLSGGADLIVSRQFNGETLDFGATELTIAGTPVFTLTTGGRGLDVLDVSLNTNNNPFTYSLVTDTGNQITTINGSFLLDATASLNGFGYYDLQLDVSSRQTVINDGRFNDDTFENDFDIGPIDIRGNIFADVLAVVTDPIFQAMGIENIFAQFSGAGQFASSLDAQVQAAQMKARNGRALTEQEIAELGSATALAAAMGIDIPDMSFLADVEVEPVNTGDEVAGQRGQVIPEPATLVLLGLSAAVLLRRRWGR